MSALTNAEPLISYRRDVAATFVDALKKNGIRLSVMLPDAVLHPMNELLLGDSQMRSIMCSREDEGIAIAMGASWGGLRSAITMEGSGIGLSVNIIGRAMLQRSPTLMIVSHNTVFGEKQSYHAATRTIVEPVLSTMRVPYYVLKTADEIPWAVKEILGTMDGQRIPVAICVPRHILIDG
jgi:sulfopyruvate decarboxylase TPP-binding subunit